MTDDLLKEEDMLKLSPTIALALLLATTSANAEAPSYGDLRAAVRSEDASIARTARTALLELAKQGDARAAVIVGQADVEGGDPIAAVVALEGAAAAGNLPALQILSKIYREEGGALEDPAKALATDLAAWEAGDVFAANRAANMLIPTDPAKAREILETASKLDGFPGWMSLGDARARAIGGAEDGPGAFAAYVKAKEAGKPWANIRIARMLRTGVQVDLDPQGAIAAYEAARNGREDEAELASAELAAGHITGDFGAFSVPAEGAAIARAAMMDGEVSTAVAILSIPARYDETVSSLADLRGPALEIATEAAQSGDEKAATKILAYWHGMAGRDPKAAKKASAAISKFGDLIDPALVTRAEMSAIAEASHGRSDLSRAAAALAGLSGRDYTSGLLDLRKVNMNAYVYAVQDKLADLGFYQSKPNGLLTSGTISAINIFCHDRKIGQACATGPLSSRSAVAIGQALAQ